MSATVTTRVSALTVEYAGCGSHELDVTLTYESPGGDKTLAKELRLAADDLDPQDTAAELAVARQEVQQIGQLKGAIKTVIQYYDAGDRGTALHEAVRYLRAMAQEYGMT